ncbi:MAG TPA: hypothetical protein VGT43_03850 [Burkholderiales bacterium]|nr:hypothetical protein [Burkholderiales bacterium]
MASVAALGRINELMVKILLGTCVRKGELGRARKAELDLAAGTWTIFTIPWERRLAA